MYSQHELHLSATANITSPLPMEGTLTVIAVALVP